MVLSRQPFLQHTRPEVQHGNFVKISLQKVKLQSAQLQKLDFACMFYWICKSRVDKRLCPYNQIYPPVALQEDSLVDKLGQLLSLPGFQCQYHCVIKRGSRYYTISCLVVNQQTVRGYCSGHRQSGTSHFATLKGSFSVKCCSFVYFLHIDF